MVKRTIKGLVSPTSGKSEPHFLLSLACGTRMPVHPFGGECPCRQLGLPGCAPPKVG